MPTVQAKPDQIAALSSPQEAVWNIEGKDGTQWFVRIDKSAERWEVSECVWDETREDWKTGRILTPRERKAFFAEYGPLYEC